MSDSVWPHRRQPTRLSHPWDSPGKNTGVGCHFLLQCMKVKSESEVAQSCPTLSDPMTAAYQAPPSMGFSRQEYRSGVPLPSPNYISTLYYKYNCIVVVMSNSLQPHAQQHTSLLCPSLSPRVCSNSYLLSWWCHPTISSCHPLLILPSIFPNIRVFSKSLLFASCGQSTRASASALVLPMNIQGWFPLGTTGLISLQSKGLSKVFSSTTVRIHQFFSA